MTEVQEAFTTLCDAIAQRYPGKPQWFAIVTDNLIYKTLFGTGAKELRARYGLTKKASLCAVLPEEACHAMIERMTFITQHLQSGDEYAVIKELLLAEHLTEPLVLTPVPVPKKEPSKSKHVRFRRVSSTPLPGQLCLPGLGVNEDA